MHVGKNRLVQSFPNRSSPQLRKTAPKPAPASLRVQRQEPVDEKKEQPTNLQPPDGATDGVKRLADASDTIAHRGLRSAGRSLARVLLPLGLALDGADVLKGYQADQARGDGKKTQTWAAVGEAAGGYAGGGLGAAAGFAVGTMILPGPGSLIGAALGAFLGGWGGSAAGHSATEAALTP